MNAAAAAKYMHTLVTIQDNGVKKVYKPGALFVLLLLQLIRCAFADTIVALDGSISVSVSATSGLESITVGTNTEDNSAPHTYVVTGALTDLSTEMGAIKPPPSTTCLLTKRGGARRVVGNGVIGDGVSISRHWECQSPHGPAAVKTIDTFAPSNRSIRVNTAISTNLTQAFTVPLATGLHWSADSALGKGGNFWTTWTKGCVQNNGRAPGMCLGGRSAWLNPLSPASMPDTPLHLRYGAVALGASDSFVTPLLTVRIVGASGSVTYFLCLI